MEFSHSLFSLGDSLPGKRKTVSTVSTFNVPNYLFERQMKTVETVGVDIEPDPQAESLG